MAGNNSHPDLDDIVLFLIEHKWIYDFKLTRYMVDRAYEQIPDEWRDVLKNLSLEELSNLPFGILKDDWPASFKDFVRKCLAYSIPRDQVTSLQGKLHDKITCSTKNSATRNSGQSDAVNSEPLKLSRKHDDVTAGHSRESSTTKNLGHSNAVNLGQADTVNSAVVEQLKLGATEEMRSSYKTEKPKKNNQCSNFPDTIVNPEMHGNMSETGRSKSEIGRGMSEKKWHEVGHMTSIIDQVTRLTDNDVIVDVGSGLGYLGHFLHTIYGHRVLGLEGKSGHSQGANARLKTSDSCHLLGNVTCEIYDNKQSQSEFIQNVLDWFTNLSRNHNVCSHFVNQTENTKTSLTSKNYFLRHSPEIEKNTINHVNSERSRETEKQTASNVNLGHSPKIEKQPENSGHSLESEVNDKTVTPQVDCQPSSFYESSVQIHSHLKDMGNISQQVGQSCSHLEVNNIANTEVRYRYPYVCMVGLHCCGDLTPTMLKYFTQIPWITSLCVVSCCYHRMCLQEEHQQHDNFPLSQQLQTALNNARKLYPEFMFSPFCLRLAAQETRARWRGFTAEDHNIHMKNVAYRALLEYCIENSEGNLTLKKTARRLAHKANFESFHTYMKATYKHVHVKNQDSGVNEQDIFERDMLAAYHMFEDSFCLIEPLTALQYLLQPVIESLIYTDRQSYLTENGFHSNIIPIFDEFISPRNLALIAYK